MRQIANETDRIGHDDLVAARQFEPAYGRIECGEQLVLDIHIRIGERIEQRRFARVGCNPRVQRLESRRARDCDDS